MGHSTKSLFLDEGSLILTFRKRKKRDKQTDVLHHEGSFLFHILLLNKTPNCVCKWARDHMRGSF